MDTYIMKKLKAKLRDWLFKDYEWVMRAEVQRHICAIKWKNRDRPYIVRQLDELSDNIL